jgi:hypothetical protein
LGKSERFISTFVLIFPPSQYLEHSSVAVYSFPFMRVTLRRIYITVIFIDHKDTAYFSNYKIVIYFLSKILVATNQTVLDIIDCVSDVSCTKTHYKGKPAPTDIQGISKNPKLCVMLCWQNAHLL